jgi:cyclase
MRDEFHSKHFTLINVSDGVYAAIAKEGSGSVGNAGFIDLGDKTIVFDTFNTQQAADDLKRFAEKITNRPITYVINSHWHGDHVRGNQVFKDSTIISTQVTYKKMREIHPERMMKQKNDIKGLSHYIQSLEEKLRNNNDEKIQLQIDFLKEIEASLPKLHLVLPHQTFHDKITLYGSKRSAELFTLGGGHSYCDAVLYIPEEKVIFIGDLLFVDVHPTFFDESNPKNWLHILKKIEEMDIEFAVPGHGSVGTKKNISNLIEYMNEIITVANTTKYIDQMKIPDKYQHWSAPENYQQSLKKLQEK